MDFGRNTETGEYVVRETPWSEPQVVDKETWDRLKAPASQRFERAVVNSGKDLVGGLGELATGDLAPIPNAIRAIAGKSRAAQGIDAVNERSRELGRSNDREQALLGSRSPLTNFAGEAVPDIALGMVAPSARAGIGIEGALGAARTPENPALGAGIGIGLGAAGQYGARGISAGARKGLDMADTVISGVSNRAARRSATQAAERGDLLPNNSRAADLADVASGKLPSSPMNRGGSLSAAANADPSDMLSQPVLGNVIDSQRLAEDYGIPTSQAQSRILDTTDPREFELARAEDKDAFDRFRSGATGPIDKLNRVFSPPEDYGALQTVQQRGLNKAVMSAMGDPNSVAATRSNVGAARKAISDSFDDIAQRAGPIDMKPEELADMSAQLMDEVPDEMAARTVERRIALLEKSRDPKTGLIPIDRFLAVKNEVAADMAQAYKNQSSLLVGDALRSFSEFLDYKLFNQLDAEDKIDMKGNRFKWGVANAALRRGAATNGRGDVNLKSFKSSYAQKNNRYKIGYDDSEFATFLDTMDAVMHKESRDSGTPSGLAPILGEIGSALGVPGAGFVR